MLPFFFTLGMVNGLFHANYGHFGSFQEVIHTTPVRDAEPGAYSTHFCSRRAVDITLSCRRIMAPKEVTRLPWR